MSEPYTHPDAVTMVDMRGIHTEFAKAIDDLTKERDMLEGLLFNANNEIYSMREKLKTVSHGLYKNCYLAVAGAADALMEENERLQKVEQVARNLVFAAERTDAEKAYDELERLLK